MAATLKISGRAKETSTTKQALRLYLKEISKIPLLSPVEEKALGKRAQSGDERAMARLVESNLRFVVKIAKRYRRLGVSFLDLINEGNLGLMEAAKRFNPDRNVKFISYAVWWIRQSILAALSNMARPIRLPIKINAALYRVGVSISNRMSDLNHRPTIDEVAADLGMSSKELVSILEVGGEGISLNQPLTKEKEAVLEDFLAQKVIPSAEHEVIQRSIRKSLGEVLGELGQREQQILKLRYGLEDDTTLTLQQIGDRIGLSRERVRQIEEKTLRKLRQNQKTLSLMHVCNNQFSHV